MPAPKTRKWRAWLNLQPGSENQLHVTGDVEVSATNKEPVLRRAQPQGINPKILILDLSIRELGIGEQVITWREAQYMEMGVAPGQYTQVEIRWETSTIATIDRIEETH